MSTIKTAISLEKSLFEEAEELARHMKMSRSRLFSLALQEFIRKQENKALLEQINSAYDEISDDKDVPDTDAIRRQMRRMLQDKW